MHSLSGVTLALAITTAGLAGAPTIFDIEFDGGTVAQWIAAVQAKAPESNIMVQADGESVSVPALSLHSVSVQTCVELVGHIPGASCTEVGGGVAGASVWVRAEEAVRKAYLPVLWLGGAAAGVVLSAFGMGAAAAAVVIPSWSAAIGLGVADAIKNPID